MGVFTAPGFHLEEDAADNIADCGEQVLFLSVS